MRPLFNYKIPLMTILLALMLILSNQLFARWQPKIDASPMDLYNHDTHHTYFGTYKTDCALCHSVPSQCPCASTPRYRSWQYAPTHAGCNVRVWGIWWGRESVGCTYSSVLGCAVPGIGAQCCQRPGDQSVHFPVVSRRSSRIVCADADCPNAPSGDGSIATTGAWPGRDTGS